MEICTQNRTCSNLASSAGGAEAPNRRSFNKMFGYAADSRVAAEFVHCNACGPIQDRIFKGFATPPSPVLIGPCSLTNSADGSEAPNRFILIRSLAMQLTGELLQSYSQRGDRPSIFGE